MKRRSFTRAAVISLLAVLVAISVPVVIALYLVYEQTLESQSRLALNYANLVIDRSDATGDQIFQALNLMSDAALEDPCSEASITVMRRVDVTSNYLQTIGFVVDNQMVCSAYGTHDPVPLGPPDIVHSNGARIRIDVRVPFAVGTSFIVVEQRGYAAVVHGTQTTDIPTGDPDIVLFLYSSETGTIMSSHGQVRPEWLHVLGDQRETVVIRDGFVVAATKSQRYAPAAVAAVPVTPLGAMVVEHMQVMLPASGIAGLVLMFMILRIQQQRTNLLESGFQLGERVKELTLMHNTARLLMDRTADKQEIFDAIARLIPEAMQFPSLCRARVSHDGITATSAAWSTSKYLLVGRFETDDGKPGRIEVVYTERPHDVEGDPFLAEEYALVASVAEMLAAHLNRRKAEERVSQLAFFERVTGLPNRVTLERRLHEAIESAGPGGQPVALLLLNLSGFRGIVSTLGYRSGDELLRHVGNLLHGCLRGRGLLASMGGDQFVVMMERVTGHEEIEQLIERIVDALGSPTQIAGIPIKLEIAIGAALYPDHGDSAELLMQRGEIALLAARGSHGHHRVYSADIDEYQPERIALVGELHEAIANDQLVLHYQPKVDLGTGRTIGVEALVRWQHPKHGLVFPDRFIPLAERTQTINPLTRWVLAEALRQAKAWRDDGFDLEISINLSTRNLLDKNLCNSIPDMARDAGVPLDKLILEITESGIMADPEQCKLLMGDLNGRGVVFSMDDFGIGQSSLSYIKDLPIHKMKIDKSFVMGYREPRNTAIINAAIQMGHSLGMRITAEGVEGEEVLAVLKVFGCDVGQGYLFCKPIPADKLTAWFRDSRWGYGDPS